MAGLKEEEVLPYRILEEESGNPTDAVLFVGLSLVLGIICRQLLRGTRVPYTVALLILGIALGSIGISYYS
jgi:CHASE2 domain-containing sensor protein